MANLIVDAYAMALPRYACGSLLDLGCGLAPLKGIYKPLVVRSVGVDRNCTVNHAGVDIVHDLREPLPFVDGGFDTLVLSDVLEHIANPDLLWREMARVIRPGGHLLLNVPFCFLPHVFTTRWLVSKASNIPHVSRWQHRSLAKSLHEPRTVCRSKRNRSVGAALAATSLSRGKSCKAIALQGIEVLSVV
jgi:SAM-dependent methyltransferase